jgi:hypothetical protein
MKYVLLIYGNEQALAQASPEMLQAMFNAYEPYTTAIRKAGALVIGEALQPTAMATTIRGSLGTARVLDGPFAETKEQLAGLYIIDVADLDAAMQWARSCPAVDGGAVEIRPIMERPG